MSSEGQPVLAGLKTDVRPMEYRVLGGGVPLPASQSSTELLVRIQQLEASLQEREGLFTRQLENARREASEEGMQAAGNQQTAWREQCTRQLKTALDGFHTHTDNYLARVEHEVVRLALSVAERILHRESQMDPLLLSGAVRVALGQLAESTEVRLRVPAEQCDLWSETLRLMPGLPLRPQVIADPEMQGSEAVLETNLGTVNLGVHAQLKEIELGFFDLLDARRDPAQLQTSGKQG